MVISTMFPKYSTKIEGGFVTMEQKLLSTVSHLVLTTSKCTGCGICAEVCPKEAISLGMVGASIRGVASGDAPIVIDPVKCSYCGVCVIMCPFDALLVEVDGEPSLPILEQEGFPEYDFTAEISEEKCIRCTSCYEACPHDAIVRDVPVYEGEVEGGVLRQTALVSKTTFVVDKKLCTVCGVCSSLCPAIEQKRVPFNPEKVGSEGEILWTESLCDGCKVCVEACPEDAITVERTVDAEAKLPGKVTIDKDECISCTWCKLVCPSEAVTITKFFEGELIVDATKCPGGCSTCVDVCPCNALYLPTPIAAINLKKNSIEANIAINSDLCNLCGACVNACPSEDALTLKRTGIHIKGPETDLYKEILAKLCTPRTSKLVESTFGRVETKNVK
ncbi:MAG TPA: 4Fe-4S binding protein [Methanocorpusculum sp.]|nr:4Fe-4S binding protein [Methanocorpusculum sp.]HJJ54157.1 4Fe-4S binding protein [Methanocorpusculum sp.]